MCNGVRSGIRSHVKLGIIVYGVRSGILLYGVRNGITLYGVIDRLALLGIRSGIMFVVSEVG